jgi:hypothetical protein
MNLPKIGIVAVGYECAEHLDKVLKPWLDFNKKYNNIIISITHSLFTEGAKLGLPILSTDDTIEKLKEYEYTNAIHNLNVLQYPVEQQDARNECLKYLLTQDIDYIYLLDIQDEIYTEDNIINILNLIQKENFISCFKVKFKNYVIDNFHYVDDFVAPRIWNNRSNGGVKLFYYENEILFNNGKKADETSCLTIPANIAFIKHLSWCGSKEYLKRKIACHNIHYGHCSYIWDENTDTLSLNQEYYLKYNLPKPVIYKEK